MTTRTPALFGLLAALLLLAGLLTASPADAARDDDAAQPADPASAEFTSHGAIIVDNPAVELAEGSHLAQRQDQPTIVEGAAPPPGETVGSQDGYLFHGSAFDSATYPGDGSSTWRYNPNGEDIVVTRLSTGYYQVDFATTSQYFVPTVSAFYTVGVHSCSIWNYSWPGTTVRVYCFDAAGAAKDSRFTMRWTVTAEDAAFFVTSAGVVCCGPSGGSGGENPWGADPSVNKTGVGEYEVTVPGSVNFGQGNVQVSAYAASDEHCKVGKHQDEFVLVLCYDLNGNPVDNSFTLLEIGSEDDAFVWGNSPTSASYTPALSYSHNPQGFDPTISRLATGRYRINFPGHRLDYGGSVLVTAMEGNDNVCQVETWIPSWAIVRCFDNTGAAADTEFGALFTRFQVCAGQPATVEIGNNSPTAGDDVIVGTPGADIIDSLGGDDLVCADGGDDTVIGNGGNDTIYGGDGNDFITGNAGGDTIYGEAGDDTMAGNNGDDALVGGEGDDIAYAGSGNDKVFGGPGNDLLGGSSGDDVVEGNDGNDRLTGGSDTDEVDGGDGADAVNGGGGDDPSVVGGDGDDTVSGNGGNDKISGEAGNDEVRGGPGDDIVLGGPGDDFLAGNAGADECDGEAGTDTAAGNCEVTVNIP